MTNSSPDTYVRRLCIANPNLLIPHILIASLLYYVEHSPVLADDTFDWMCREAEGRWAELTHEHKSLITVEDLKAGTGYAFEYPERVKGAASLFATMFAPRVKPKKRKPKV